MQDQGHCSLRAGCVPKAIYRTLCCSNPSLNSSRRNLCRLLAHNTAFAQGETQQTHTLAHANMQGEGE